MLVVLPLCMTALPVHPIAQDIVGIPYTYFSTAPLHPSLKQHKNLWEVQQFPPKTFQLKQFLLNKFSYC